MEGGWLGSLVGVVLGLAGGILGAHVAARRTPAPRGRSAVAAMVTVIVAATGLAVIASLYAPVALRVAAAILLAVVALAVNADRVFVRGEDAGRGVAESE